MLGGPNQDYSLTEARNNFKLYLTSYRPSDTHAFARTTVKKDSAGNIIKDLHALKLQIVQQFVAAASIDNARERKKQLLKIIKSLNKL